MLRGVKASHILLSGEGRVYLSGLHSVYSMMRDGRRMRAVFDMPHHSPALLPWLSPELLRQVGAEPWAAVSHIIILYIAVA